MPLVVARLSDVLTAVLAGEIVKLPVTIGMSKYYRKEIETFMLQNTTEPIRIEISPDQTFIRIMKQPRPRPIEDLDKS